MDSSATIREILAQKGGAVWSISPQTSVYEAIALMAEKDVGSLLVIEQGRLAGILSERDYTRKVVLQGKTSRTTTVGEILSSHVICASPESTVEDCMRLMNEHHIRHLPVLEGDRIVGVVSIGDLVKNLISAQKSTIEQLETYITGYPQ